MMWKLRYAVRNPGYTIEFLIWRAWWLIPGEFGYSVRRVIHHWQIRQANCTSCSCSQCRNDGTWGITV